MVCRERGLTLVTVVFVLALLMVLSLVLTDKVLKASRAAATANRRQQALNAASAALAWGRARLAEDYAASHGWQTYLGSVPGAHRYPAAPAFTLNFNDLSVELYVRDNPDGDHDWQRDNDLRLYLLARVAAPQVSETVIEALCGYPAALAAGGYQQPGASPTGSGPELDSAPVDEFPLH